ncbi:MAG: sigma factor [Eubacteriales bacterium]|nr:sigma factor [Eubacteriales bacterium]
MSEAFSIDEQIKQWQIRQDPHEADRIVTAYQPFILKTVSSLAGRFIEVENDDEYSIGLHAFYEAMQRFSLQNGHFLSFARLVMASRIKTFWRKNNKTFALNLDDLEISDASIRDLTGELSMADDIILFARQLQVFGLTLMDLVQGSPKHRDTRQALLQIAKRLSNSEDLLAFLFQKKRLPIQAMAKRFHVSGKIIKNHKPFLIAMTIIFANPHSEIADWLKWVQRP